jgi:Uma2 family endonuclease
MARAVDAAGLHRFSVDEYHRMAEAGILAEDERVELIHGVIRAMSPINRAHVVTTSRTRQLFAERLAGRASVYEQSPLQLATLASEPEPDVAIYSNPDVDAFGTTATTPLLAIEVADSSLNYDLTTKANLYAEALVPEYWVLDIKLRVVHVFKDPGEGVYQTRTSHESGSRISPLSWPDFDVDTDSLFPGDAPASR